MLLSQQVSAELSKPGEAGEWCKGRKCACQKEKTPKDATLTEGGAFEEQRNAQDDDSKEGDEG